MSHPYSNKAEDKVGKARAQKLTSGYKRGGRVPNKVEINIFKPEGLPNQGAIRPAGPPLPPPGALAPPGPMAGGPPVPPPGAGPFARGGAVKMTAGAESGKGRLQKVDIQKRKR